MHNPIVHDLVCLHACVLVYACIMVHVAYSGLNCGRVLISQRFNHCIYYERTEGADASVEALN